MNIEIIASVIVLILGSGGLATLGWKLIKKKVETSDNKIDDLVYDNAPSLINLIEKILRALKIDEKYIYEVLDVIKAAHINSESETEEEVIAAIDDKKATVGKQYQI